MAAWLTNDIRWVKQEARSIVADIDRMSNRRRGAGRVDRVGIVGGGIRK